MNPENLNAQELNLEEMEDVTGGGIKEIVAAPVEEIVAASVDQAVEEASFDLAEETEAGLTEDGELTDDEAIEELEDADLGELTGVVDADAALKQIVDEAMDANQGESIAKVLDAALESVAFAGGDVIDPETGKLAVGEGEVVRVVTEAAAERFANLSTDQVFGAMSLAAVRATNSGVAAALGNDAVLSAMSSSQEDAEKALGYMKEGTKNAMNEAIDALADMCPESIKKLVFPMLKSICGDMFDGIFPKSGNDKIMDKLSQIEKQINYAEASIKLHVDNVTSLNELGKRYDELRAKTKTLADRVDNIRYNDRLTDAKKIQDLANLCDDSIVLDLETALNLATDAYYGDTSIALNEKSIFMAAYNSAVENAMFSREAIDACTPYMMRQLAVYMAAYAALSPVYDAYEQVYGTDVMLTTRETMASRLGGHDRDGKEMTNTVMKLYDDFFSTDKYIFVNQGKTDPVKLSRMLYVQTLGSDCTISDIQEDIKNTALNKDQVDALANYVKGKNMTLAEYLYKEMEFSNEILEKAGDNPLLRKLALSAVNSYLLSGAQEFSRSRTDRRKSKYNVEYTYHYKANMIDFYKVGATSDKKECVSKCESKISWKELTLIAFQKG